ncbi:MAG: DNA gyrase modulator, partial [Thermoplasmata archaeon]
MDLETLLKEIERNAKYGEIRLMSVKRNMVIVKNGVISGIETSEEKGFAVRVLDKNFSFYSTSNLDGANLKKVVER